MWGDTLDSREMSATESLVSGLIVDIGEAVKSVDVIITTYSASASASSKESKCRSLKKFGAIWKQDKQLESSINELKNISKDVSQSCVKFSMLFSSICDDAKKKGNCPVDRFNVLDSLIGELKAQVVTLVTSFLSSFLSSSLSYCLFSSTSQQVRSLLTHVSEFLTIIHKAISRSGTVTCSDLNSAATYEAGALIKIHEEMQKIPITNKVAIRRFIMERCLGVKETLKEFDEYVTQHHKSIEESMNQLSLKGDDENDEDDEDDEDEDDEEDIPYSEKEVVVVESSMNLVRQCLEAMKTALHTVTIVSDTIYAYPTGHSTGSIDTPPPAIRPSAAGANPTPPLEAPELPDVIPITDRCDAWVESAVGYTQEIEDLVLDLGSELYPPFQDCINTTIQGNSVALQNIAGKLVHLLEEEPFCRYNSAENISGLQTSSASFS